MNKQGILVFPIMVMIFMLIVAVITLPAVADLISSARTNLNCGNESLPTGTKMTCLVIDLYLPYFAAAILFGAAAYVLYKRLEG